MMYPYSMTQWIVGNEDIEHSCARLKKYGYDGIELAAEPYTLDADQILVLMKKYDLSCTSLCGIFTVDRDLTATDPDGASKAIQYLKDSIDFGVRVGAKLMIVVPSPVGRTSLPEGKNYEQMWEAAVRNLREAADYAQSRQFILAIEAINRYETYFVNTLDRAYQFVKEVNHPAVKMMADLFHMSIEERDLCASLRMISDELVHLHVADNTREAAGLGSTNFKEVLYQLRNLNYQGALTMEFMPRLANPYASGAMDTQSELMDRYAEQAIHYMKAMEACVFSD